MRIRHTFTEKVVAYNTCCHNNSVFWSIKVLRKTNLYGKQPMLGQKTKAFKDHLAVSLEALVPPDHFYRQLETKLDLTFVRALVQDQYAAGMGRPSLDPVVFFKLQLIM